MPQEIKTASLEWRGDLRFEGGAPGGPVALIDGDNLTAPGPMLTLLLAAASCTGADIVTILDKMRVRLRGLRLDARGTRREEEPRRYLAMHFDYRISADALDEAKARRAVELSVTKYCSVLHSLAPDLRVTYDIHLDQAG
jgi:putative redox protein